MPDQLDPLRQVAVDTPAGDTGGGNWGDELGVERKIAHRLGPCIGDHNADRAQVAQEGVGVAGLTHYKLTRSVVESAILYPIVSIDSISIYLSKGGVWGGEASQRTPFARRCAGGKAARTAAGEANVLLEGRWPSKPPIYRCKQCVDYS